MRAAIDVFFDWVNCDCDHDSGIMLSSIAHWIDRIQYFEPILLRMRIL